MNEGRYGLVFTTIPFLVCMAISIVAYVVVAVLQSKGKDPFRSIATYAFPEFIKKKTDNNEATGCGWLLKDVYLEDGSVLLLKVFRGVTLLFFGLLLLVVLLFFQLLLIDVSYSCDLEDKNKDCFEYKVWDTNRDSNEPINCSSDAVQNGTVDVVCYKIVFNAGLAMGASYGTFKISMAMMNLVATVILMIAKQPKTICYVRMVLGIVYVGVIVGIIVVQFTNLRVYLVSDNLANALQAVATLVVGFVFVFFIPWTDIVELKNEQNNQQNRGMENMAQE